MHVFVEIYGRFMHVYAFNSMRVLQHLYNQICLIYIHMSHSPFCPPSVVSSLLV